MANLDTGPQKRFVAGITETGPSSYHDGQL